MGIAKETFKTVVLVGFVYFCIGVCSVECGDGQGHNREHYQCERYCNTDCNLITDKEHHTECEKVHSSESGCHCRVHTTELGIFIISGLTVVLLLTCCVCRHCRKSRGATTSIVVVAQPDTVTTIAQPGFETHSYTNPTHSQQVYAIEMSPQTHPRHHKKREAGASAVTVITSTRMQPLSPSSMPASPMPSDRVFFEEDHTKKSESDDSTFAPPTYH